MRTGSQGSKTHQLAPLLIVHIQPQGLEASADAEWSDRLQGGDLIITALQIVVGYPRADMMNVMHADMARNPLQDPGQLVMRAALQSGPQGIPCFVAGPIYPFELMLDVK